MPRASSKRQRTRQCLVRLTEEEYDRVQAKADQSGMACAAFLRAAALGDAGPRAQRRPPADHQALRRLLGELGRVGNNLNQIARSLHRGQELKLPDLREAVGSYLQLRNAIFVALDMVPANVNRTSHDYQGQLSRQP